MEEILNILFWAALSFMAMDYTLGRATVKDMLRLILAILFAVLFVVFVNPGLM